MGKRSGSSTELTQRAERGFAEIERSAPAVLPRAARRPSRPLRCLRRGTVPRTGAAVIEPGNVAPTPRTVDGVDYIEGRDLTLIYEGKKCIHSRFCVTWGPKVFIANVKGPWINPDAMATEALTEIAHVCVSGAIRYKRKDGKPDEQPPAVNLISVREGGPYAVRADIRSTASRASATAYTLCRCGASKNKPFCDGSHHEVSFVASGEPPTGKADMLPVRDGPLAIDPLDRWAAAGARQHGDHQRHRPRGRAPRVRAAVPLRRQRHQAVLRRHPRAHRFPVELTYVPDGDASTEVA